MRGSVIVPVLIVLMLLAFLAAEVGRDLTTDYAGAAYLRETLGASWALDDAEDVARRLLENDLALGGATDNRHEVWGDFQDELDMLFRDGGPEVAGRIRDVNGLFPLRSLAAENEPKSANRAKFDSVFLRLLQGLLDGYGIEGDPQVFLDSLRYWINDVTAPRDDGDWYKEQDPPYVRTKRLPAYPEELMAIRWEDMPPEDKRTIILGRDGHPGLADLVTVWGNGKINMNTAPEPIVRAVCPVSDIAASYWAAVADYRRDTTRDLASNWYYDVAVKTGVTMDAFPTYCLGTTSAVFAMEVRCKMGGSVRHQYTLFTRKPNLGVRTVFRQSW